MKHVSVFFLLALSVSLFSQSKKIKLKLIQYVPYCGGARPTPEIEAETKKPKPYANKKLIFISDKQKVDTVTTDKYGYMKMCLVYGTYKVYEPWKYYHTFPKGTSESNLNMDCLKEEWIKEDLKLNISKKGVLMENNIKYPKCTYQFPCLINKRLPN